MGNSWPNGVDPDGKWFGIDDAVVAGIGFAIGYVSSGITTGEWGAKSLAAGGLTALSAWIGYNTAGISTAGTGLTSGTWNFVAGMAVSSASSSFMPSVTVPIGNFSLTASAGLGFGTGGFTGGANFGLSYSDGEVSLFAGVGLGSNSKSWGGGFKINGVGGSYYQTRYGNAPGPDGKPHPQKVGAFGIKINDFSLRFENDFLAGTGDKWRTQALEFGVGNFVFGASIYTNDAENEGEKELEPGSPSPKWGLNKSKEFTSWDNGKAFSAPVWVGIRNGNQVHRFGYSDKRFHDFTQNGVHTQQLIKAFNQNYYLNYSEFYTGPTTYSGYYNPYSLFNSY
jgi:hypothetical protein